MEIPKPIPNQAEILPTAPLSPEAGVTSRVGGLQGNLGALNTRIASTPGINLKTGVETLTSLLAPAATIGIMLYGFKLMFRGVLGSK